MTESTVNRVRKDYRTQRRAIEERLHRAELERRRAVEERDAFYGLQVDPEVEYYEDVATRQPGDTNWVGFGFDIHPQVTLISSAILILFVAWTLLVRRTSGNGVQRPALPNQRQLWLALYFRRQCLCHRHGSLRI